ncbi:MAG: PAS domain S-box protein, partial [Actinomycetota bacterium]
MLDTSPVAQADPPRPPAPAAQLKAGDMPGDRIIRYLVSANLEARFHRVLEAIPDAIVTCDDDRCIRHVNARAEAVFGCGRADLVGRPVDLVFPGHRGFLDDAAGEAYRLTPGRPGVEVGALRRDGSAFPAEVTVTLVETTAGRLAVVAVRDVTERRRAAGELERALERERSAAERLRELDGLKDEFLSTVSHELRT